MKKPRGKAARTAGRPTHAVDFQAEVDGVARLTPTGFHSFLFAIKCTQCGCVRAGVRIENEEQAVEGSRGTVSFVMSCRDCKRQCKVSYVDAAFQAESADAPDYSEWQRLLTVDCRGCSIDSISCDGWTIESESGAKWEWDAADDFFEYDPDLERPVIVAHIAFRVVSIG
jgi:hypothetical protein